MAIGMSTLKSDVEKLHAGLEKLGDNLRAEMRSDKAEVKEEIKNLQSMLIQMRITTATTALGRSAAPTQPTIPKENKANSDSALPCL